MIGMKKNLFKIRNESSMEFVKCFHLFEQQALSDLFLFCFLLFLFSLFIFFTGKNFGWTSSCSFICSIVFRNLLQSNFTISFERSSGCSLLWNGWMWIHDWSRRCSGCVESSYSTISRVFQSQQSRCLTRKNISH